MNTNVVLYDTTLRDGSQAEGINFSCADKVRIAQKLDIFGIRYIEGGWPGSNHKDIEFFERIRDVELTQARVAAFGSTRRMACAVEDDPQVQLLLKADTPVVTIFGKTSLLHVKEVLRTTPEENVAMIADTVAYLKANGREVIYDAEHCFDGYRESPDYAMDCLRAAAEAGADWLALCDTNGGSLPSLISEVTARALTEIGKPVAIHSHDDSGLGVANALVSIEAGATQVQGTINGFGERTGNCNLTSVIPNLQLKMGRPVVADEQLALLRELSLLVDEIANQHPNIRAPYVGQASFAHKGGTHVNAINKLIHSYEHIDPALVGNSRRVLVGELSGRTNVMLKARELGFEVEEKSDKSRALLERVKELENEGYEFESADASFELLLLREFGQFQASFELLEYHVSIRHNPVKQYDSCEATVKIAVSGQKMYTVAEGDGPVNALDAALRLALANFYSEIWNTRLTDYKVRIVNSTQGSAAKTRVLVESTNGHDSWTTVGVSTNIVEASWIALTDALDYQFLLDRRRGG